MTTDRSSPASWVQLLQALVARELVEELGLSSTRAARLLGLAPSAVSQYLSGHRLKGPFLAYSTNREARRIARGVAERLTDPSAAPGSTVRLLLEGTEELAEVLGKTAGRSAEPRLVPSPEPILPQRTLVRWLRHRVRAEQDAVARCMRLAQKARDELTRAIFRQIALDSLRHAEIVASLEPYLARGILRADVSGVTRREVEQLIVAERRAEGTGEEGLPGQFEGTMGLLLASMEADEKKHTRLLEGLLHSPFVGDRTPTPRR